MVLSNCNREKDESIPRNIRTFTEHLQAYLNFVDAGVNSEEIQNVSIFYLVTKWFRLKHFIIKRIFKQYGKIKI